MINPFPDMDTYFTEINHVLLASVNKICVGCMLGYYKDVEGNSVNCSSCPVNKITANVNSTSVDACSIGK
jgi:hypothetical protein